MSIEDLIEQKMDELKALRAQAFINSHPENRYSRQFVQDKRPDKQLTKSELYARGVRERREARAKRKENLFLFNRTLKEQKKEARRKIFVARVMKAYELKQEGRTLEKVGAVMGITRERARQLLKFGVNMGLFQSYWKSHKITHEPLELVCKRCGKTFFRKGYAAKYCSIECRCPFNFLSPEEKLEAYRKKQRDKYHTPEGKIKQIAAMKKYYAKVRLDPVKHRELLVKQKKYQDTYHEKKRLQAMINVRDTINSV